MTETGAQQQQSIRTVDNQSPIRDPQKGKFKILTTSPSPNLADVAWIDKTYTEIHFRYYYYYGAILRSSKYQYPIQVISGFYISVV